MIGGADFATSDTKLGERYFASSGIHILHLKLKKPLTFDLPPKPSAFLIFSLDDPLSINRRHTAFEQRGVLLRNTVAIIPMQQQESWEIEGVSALLIEIPFRFIASLSLTPPTTETTMSGTAIEAIGQAILTELPRSDYLSYTYTEQLIRTLLFAIAGRPDYTFNNTHHILNGSKMEQLKAYIHMHLEERIATSQLAAHAGMSVHHFTRRFKHFTGITPQEFIKHYRLEEAKRLIEHTHFSIVEISYRTGFSSQSHLTKAFNKKYGMPPRRFREMLPYQAQLL